MTSDQWFHKIGTVSLGSDIMLQTIGFGEIVRDWDGSLYIDSERNPSVLQLGLWTELVPQVFKNGAYSAIERIQSKFLYERASEDLVQRFVSEFQAIAERDYYDKRLNSQGWDINGSTKPTC